jgi:hypothetical protein
LNGPDPTASDQPKGESARMISVPADAECDAAVDAIAGVVVSASAAAGTASSVSHRRMDMIFPSLPCVPAPDLAGSDETGAKTSPSTRSVPG